MGSCCQRQGKRIMTWMEGTMIARLLFCLVGSALIWWHVASCRSVALGRAGKCACWGQEYRSLALGMPDA